MTKIIYSTRSEVIKELQEDLAMYKRHLDIDIQNELTTEEHVIKMINLIDDTAKEIANLKGAC